LGLLLLAIAHCRLPNSIPKVPVLEELLRTNDIVLISFVEALLRDAGITAFVADQNMSIIEGSLGVLPRRVMVPEDEIDAARKLLHEAGIGKEISEPKTRP
jgi:hypothetical protein